MLRNNKLLVLMLSITVSQFNSDRVLANYEERKNITRPFTVHVTRLICIETPYAETEVKECRAILRRGEKSLLCVTLYAPKVYNVVWLQFRLHYKFTSYRPLLIDGQAEVCSFMRGDKTSTLENYVYNVLKDVIPSIVHPCPHGNRTYTERTVFKEKYAPQSIPAGDYRMDLRFASGTNVTLFWIQMFATVRRRGVLGSMLEW